MARAGVVVVVVVGGGGGGTAATLVLSNTDQCAVFFMFGRISVVPDALIGQSIEVIIRVFYVVVIMHKVSMVLLT